MKIQIVIALMATALISCNKDKKTETGAASSEAASSSAQSSSASLPDSTTFHLYGPEKKAPMFAYCAKNLSSNLPGFKALFEEFKTLDGGEQEWGGECGTTNRIGECKGIPLPKQSTDKADFVFYGSGMGPEMDSSTTADFKKRCEEFKGTWVK